MLISAEKLFTNGAEMEHTFVNYKIQALIRIIPNFVYFMAPPVFARRQITFLADLPMYQRKRTANGRSAE